MNGRWNTGKDKKGGHQEPATDTKHTRQKADARTKPKDQKNVDREFGNGEVDLHNSADNQICS